MEVRHLSFVFFLLLTLSCAKKPTLERSTPQFLQSTEKNTLYFMSHTAFDGTGHLGRIDLRYAKKEFSPYKTHSDASLYVPEEGSTLYVVNSWGKDNLELFDKQTLDLISDYQLPGTNGKNYQDLLPLSEEDAYLTLARSKELLRINPKTGKIKNKIDLSEYAPAGQDFPHMTKMMKWKDKVLLTLQRLLGNNLEVKEPGMLVLIDSKNDKVLSKAALHLKNPTSALTFFGDKVLLASQGNLLDKNFTSKDNADGIEEIQFTPELSSKVFMTGSELGGKPFEVVGNDNFSWALCYSDSTFKVQLKKIDRKTKKVTLLREASSMGMQGLAYDSTRNIVFVGLREKTDQKIQVRKILVFDGAENTLQFAYDVDYLPTQLVLAR